MTRVREWKPGDVARVNGSIAVRTDDNMSWWTTSGRLSDPNVAYARPLVVIDFEDREQVERLVTAYAKQRRLINGEDVTRTDDMQAALREFANPTPPKPDEPTGLGAVVEDASGVKWLRCFGDAGYYVWRSKDGFENHRLRFSDIDAVKVLSDGIPA